MRDNKHYIINIYQSFTVLFEQIPESLCEETEGLRWKFANLFRGVFDQEVREESSEFLAAGVNSGAHKEQMLDILCGIIGVIKNSGKASAEQLGKLEEIRLNLQESMDQSFVKSGNYQMKWYNLLGEARNEVSGAGDRQMKWLDLLEDARNEKALSGRQ